MRKMIFLIFILNLSFITSCSSQKVWLIKKETGSGIVASNKRLPIYSKHLRKKIPCPSFSISRVEKKSQHVEKVYRHYLSSSPATVGTTSSLHDPMNNNSGSAIASNRVLFDEKKETWYEYSYSCKADKAK